MKHFNLFLVLLILFTGILYSNDLKAAVGVKEILNIERGREAGKIDYNLPYWGDSEKTLIRTGVETFVVDEEERVYLSNYATGKIKAYHENRLEGEYDISQFFQPRDIEILSGLLYIYEDNGRVTELVLDNMEKRAEYRIPLFIPAEKDAGNIGEISSVPEKRSMPIRFVSDHGKKEARIVYDNHGLLRPGEEGVSSPELDKLQQVEEVSYQQLLGFDEDKNIYILGIDLFENRDMLEIRELVYRFDDTGNLTGLAEVLEEKNYIVPSKYLYVNAKGSLYQLLVLEDRVQVYRLVFQDPESFLDNRDKGKRLVPETVAMGSAEQEMREILYKRAVDLVEYTWTYNPEYHANILTDTDLPYYIKILDREEELRGIPYCWGGFDSLDTRSANQPWANFPDAVKKGVMTGNVGLTPNYLPGTSGLDCSGFISAVLKLDSRKASWYFYYNIDLVKEKSFARLELMDVLAKNGHLLFYLNKHNYGINTIETNMLGSQWKVKYYNWSWRALRDNAYRVRGYKNIGELPAVLGMN